MRSGGKGQDHEAAGGLAQQGDGMVLQEGYLVSGKAAGAKELPDCRHHQHHHGKVDAGEQGVGQALSQAGLCGVFRRTEGQQIHGHHGQVQAHHLIGAGQIGVHQHIRRRCKGCGHQHAGGQPCALGYKF